MKNTITIFLILISLVTIQAQSPVGKWKMISDISEYEGQKFDSHKALVSTRPCTSKIFYEINTDKTYILNAKNSGCDQS